MIPWLDSLFYGTVAESNPTNSQSEMQAGQLLRLENGVLAVQGFCLWP
jgi:hypothetical protein